MFSIGARQLASELVGAIEQVELAAGLDAHAVEDDRAERAAAAAQRHRHQSTVDSVAVRTATRSRRACAAWRSPPATAGRRRRRGCRARRRPGRTTPAARDDARADRESRPTCGRRRTGGWRRGRRCRARRPGCSVAERLCANSSSSARSRAAARRAGAGGTARAPSETRRPPRRVVVHARRRRRRVEADGEQADALAAADERQQQRRAGVQPRRRDRASARSASATSVGVPPRERVGDERRFVRAGHPRIGRAGRRGRSPTSPAARRCGGCARNSSDRDAAGDVERVLVQVRQQIDRRACCARAAKPAAAAPSPAPPVAGPEAGRVSRLRSCFSGHLDTGFRADCRRFYCDRSDSDAIGARATPSSGSAMPIPAITSIRSGC